MKTENKIILQFYEYVKFEALVFIKPKIFVML